MSIWPLGTKKSTVTDSNPIATTTSAMKVKDHLKLFNASTPNVRKKLWENAQEKPKLTFY